MNEPKPLSGPDFSAGVALSSIADGALLPGMLRGSPVLVARRGEDVFAVGAVCTHYSGPLAEGLVVGDTAHCTAVHRQGGRKLAVATIFRDLESLRAEVEFERQSAR